MTAAARAHGKSDGLWAYYSLTYLVSWACWGALIAFRIPGGAVHPEAPPPPPLGLILLGVGALSPSIAGVVLTWRTGGLAGLRDLWRRMTKFDLGGGPYLVIVAVPLVVSMLRVAFRLASGDGLLASPLLAQPALLIPFTAQVFVFGPLMEEPGWRGFALDRLLRRWGFVPASLVQGVLHGLWHWPLFFVLGTVQQSWGNPLLESSLFIANVLSAAVIFTWLHLATSGSVWAAILFHATSNFGLSFLATLYAGGTADRLAQFLATAALAALLTGLARPARLGSRRTGQPGTGPVAL